MKTQTRMRSLIGGGAVYRDGSGATRPGPANPSVGSTLAPSHWYQDEDSPAYPWPSTPPSGR